MARVAVWLFGCLAVWLFGCLAVGCPAPTPLLAAPAAGRLRGGTRVGARVLRELTRRGCPSGARSAKRVPRRTPQPPRRRLPRSAAKGSQTGGRLFFGHFLLAKQKKVTRTPGDSRPPPSTPACFSNQRAMASTSSARTDEVGVPRLRQAQLERVWWGDTASTGSARTGVVGRHCFDGLSPNGCGVAKRAIGGALSLRQA